jgi:hypothetical protein
VSCLSFNHAYVADSFLQHGIKINVTKAPDAILAWVRKQTPDFNKSPKINDISAYKQEWKGWYVCLPPKGCSKINTKTKWQLLKNTKKDMQLDWSLLRKGTYCGFFMVLMSLAWWAQHVQSDNDPVLFDAMEDIEWALECMTNETKKGQK